MHLHVFINVEKLKFKRGFSECNEGFLFLPEEV